MAAKKMPPPFMKKAPPPMKGKAKPKRGNPFAKKAK